jgi:hypothetical protein
MVWAYKEVSSTAEAAIVGCLKRCLCMSAATFVGGLFAHSRAASWLCVLVASCTLLFGPSLYAQLRA